MISRCLLSYQMTHSCDHTHDESNSLYKTWLCVLLLCQQCTAFVTIRSSFFFIDITFFGLTCHLQLYRLLWLSSLLLTVMLFCFSYAVASDYFWLCGLTICFILVSLSCTCLPYGLVWCVVDVLNNFCWDSGSGLSLQDTWIGSIPSVVSAHMMDLFWLYSSHRLQLRSCSEFHQYVFTKRSSVHLLSSITYCMFFYSSDL
jgi:hypothetical protein